jgi:hypothetical protein
VINSNIGSSNNVEALRGDVTAPEASEGAFQSQAKGNAPAKVGRNEPCPCGSGKKFKKCCGPGQDCTGLTHAVLDGTSEQQMIVDFVVLYRQDGDIDVIYEPVSAFAGVSAIKIAKFLRLHDTKQLPSTKAGERLLASVVKYDYSTGKVLNVEMHDRNDSVKDPLDFMQRLLDSPKAKEGLDQSRVARLTPFLPEGSAEIYEKGKVQTFKIATDPYRD